MARSKTRTDLALLSKKLLEKGIQIISPDEFGFLKPAVSIRLGYACVSEVQIEQVIKEMAKLL